MVRPGEKSSPWTHRTMAGVSIDAGVSEMEITERKQKGPRGRDRNYATAGEAHKSSRLDNTYSQSSTTMGWLLKV